MNASPIRVAFATQAGDKAGGAEESMALLIEHLPSDFERHAILFGEGAYADRLRSLGVRVHVVPVSERLARTTREGPKLAGALEVPPTLFAVARILRRERIEIVHTNSVKTHLIVAPAARLLGIAAVMHLRDMVGGTGRTIVRAAAAASARRRIAISHAVERWYGLPHTTVIPNPVDLSRYAGAPARDDARRALGLAPGPAVIAIVGRINRWKGHDRFLRIAARLAAARDLRAVIFGEARFRDADFVPELHALAQTLGIADRVDFIPWRDDLETVYAAIDVLCNCSEREPFGRTMIEAAAAGVPSVAFDDGGAPDIIEDGTTGRIVRASDEAAFADAVAELLDDAPRRQAMGKAARTGAERFTAATHAARVAAILRASARRYRAVQ